MLIANPRMAIFKAGGGGGGGLAMGEEESRKERIKKIDICIPKI